MQNIKKYVRMRLLGRYLINPLINPNHMNNDENTVIVEGEAVVAEHPVADVAEAVEAEVAPVVEESAAEVAE